MLSWILLKSNTAGAIFDVAAIYDHDERWKMYIGFPEFQNARTNVVGSYYNDH